MSQDHTTPRNCIPLVKASGGSNRNIKTRQLTVIAKAMIDERDYEFLSTRTWYLNPNGNSYACRGLWTGQKKINITMHNEVWSRYNGPIPEGCTIDHIDRDSLNNHLDNLRSATRQQQNSNQGIRVDNTVGVKGVHWDKRENKYHSRISLNERRISLGRYSSKIEAVVAYNFAAQAVFGEFAYLNPIPEGSMTSEREAEILATIQERHLPKILRTNP